MLTSKCMTPAARPVNQAQWHLKAFSKERNLLQAAEGFLGFVAIRRALWSLSCSGPTAIARPLPFWNLLQRPERTGTEGYALQMQQHESILLPKSPITAAACKFTLAP